VFGAGGGSAGGEEGGEKQDEDEELGDKEGEGGADETDFDLVDGNGTLARGDAVGEGGGEGLVGLGVEEALSHGRPVFAAREGSGAGPPGEGDGDDHGGEGENEEDDEEPGPRPGSRGGEAKEADRRRRG
jgi:hypothetical protein